MRRRRLISGRSNFIRNQMNHLTNGDPNVSERTEKANLKAVLEQRDPPLNAEAFEANFLRERDVSSFPHEFISVTRAFDQF